MTVNPTRIPWAENTYDDRPERICIACGKRDRAPRDQVALPDGNVVYYHKDCHALMGCTVCQEELEVVAGGAGPKGKKNEALWLAILEESVKPEAERASVYTRDDVTGSYQAAIDNGEIVDKSWKEAK